MSDWTAAVTTAAAPGRNCPLPARILAVADTYRTLIEDRPHRSALDAGPGAAAAARRGDSGTRSTPMSCRPCSPPPGTRAAGPGRTAADGTLRPGGGGARLVAKGCSNAEIASRLVISRRTAEHHVQHIYAKIGVSSRAAATLFAVEHRLLDRDG